MHTFQSFAAFFYIFLLLQKLTTNTLIPTTNTLIPHPGKRGCNRRNRRPINTLDDIAVSHIIASEGRQLLSVRSVTLMHDHLQSPTSSSFYRLETQRKEPQSQNHESPCPHPCPRRIFSFVIKRQPGFSNKHCEYTRLLLKGGSRLTSKALLGIKALPL